MGSSKRPQRKAGILPEVVSRVLAVGADGFEVEYENGRDVVYAIGGSLGVSVAEYEANSPESCGLRDALMKALRKKRIEIGGVAYFLQVERHESFGEWGFRVRIAGGRG